MHESLNCFTLQATLYTRGGLPMTFQKLGMGLKYHISNVIVEEKHQPCRCLQLYRRHVFRKHLLDLFYDDFRYFGRLRTDGQPIRLHKMLLSRPGNGSAKQCLYTELGTRLKKLDVVVCHVLPHNFRMIDAMQPCGKDSRCLKSVDTLTLSSTTMR